MTALFHTVRAAVFVELGIGDTRIPTGQARWDVARWDRPGDTWAGTEPTWLDVTCDARHWDTTAGRSSILERFLPGSMRLVLNDPHGTYSVVPPPNDVAALLLRPGRQIRWGIDHATLGRIVMWRGIVDEVNPVYPPVGEGTDGIEVVAVDALGDVGRAKLAAPIAAPTETVTNRVHAILDAVAVDPARRVVYPASTALIADQLDGQAADLLGRCADSEGGALYGDTDGRIVFRPRDWQTYVPATPPDATIGNHPATPATPAYLTPTVGTVTTPDTADDPAGQIRSTADPADAATYHRLVATTRTVGINPAGAVYPGHISWAQMEAINRARLQFPGVAGNYLSVPDAANLNITGDIEIVARLQRPNGGPAAQRIVSKDTIGGTNPNRGWTAGMSASGLLSFAMLPAGVTTSSAAPGVAAGAMFWARTTRSNTTGVVTYEWAPDAPTEPTSWTALTPSGTPTPGAILTTNGPVRIGDRATTTTNSLDPFQGRIARVIVRNGIAGTTVLDVSENNAGTMATATTFVATTGQTVTVNQTAGNTIVQPQPDRVVWRFAAADYPGTGLSYVDPRGRTWTLSAAGAITPAVPAVAADVCPSGWTTSFRRADMTTRAIMGRADGVSVTVDDVPGQIAYGIEPFQRSDLWCVDPAQLDRLARRWITVRSGNAVPRVESVRLDAARGDDVVDVLAGLSPYEPTRWRCRHVDDGRLVFDREMFVTAVAHTVTAGNAGARWTALVSLDPAAPFAATGGRWDGATWDRAVWTVAP